MLIRIPFKQLYGESKHLMKCFWNYLLIFEHSYKKIKTIDTRVLKSPAHMKRIREKPVLLTGSPRLRATKLCLLTWAFIFDKVVFALRKAWIACFCFCWIPPRLPRKLTLPPRTRPPRLPRNGRLPSEKREEGVPRPNPLVFWGNVFLKFVF